MREMKDSGVEWIGEIPSTWIPKKIKNAVAIIGSGTTPPSNNFIYYEDGNIPWIQSGDIYGKLYINQTSVLINQFAIQQFSALKIYTHDFLVMAMYGGSVGNIAISKIDACVNQACCCIKPDNENYIKFMFYWISMCKPDFLRVSEGGGQPNISQVKIKSQYYMQPLFEEQKTIADFLDAKCAEIDALTDDIRAQIDTLEQYRRSVIIEAVTKGLNPDAEMRDSGIPWICMIPKNWQVDKLKFHLKRCEPRNPGNMPVLSLYRDFGVIPKDSRDDNYNVTSEDTSNYKYVRPGDLVINKMKAWQGSVAVSDYEGIVSPAYYVFKFTDDKYHKRYFHYLLRSCYKDEFMRLSGGIRVNQWDLSSEELENIRVIIPPIAEQCSIADFLDTKCAEIDTTLADKQAQLETLADYKKSLIFEYVTGKKEVPAS